jgi:hypothetical protein
MLYVKKIFAGINTLRNLEQVVLPLALRLPLKAFRLFNTARYSIVKA